jgi:hypothetical protein
MKLVYLVYDVADELIGAITHHLEERLWGLRSLSATVSKISRRPVAGRGYVSREQKVG